MPEHGACVHAVLTLTIPNRAARVFAFSASGSLNLPSKHHDRLAKIVIKSSHVNPVMNVRYR
eukprot:350388-Chlamydomonas_euryale.AAC.16